MAAWRGLTDRIPALTPTRPPHGSILWVAGAIDSFRMVATPWVIEDPYGWDTLPGDQKRDPQLSRDGDIPDHVVYQPALSFTQYSLV